jgi:hypothetical protein
MNYDEAKKRVMLQLYYGRMYVFGSDVRTKREMREYKALVAEFGKPNDANYFEDLDDLSVHLAGCLDPAPQWVCDEVSALSQGATWHQVYVERMTDYLMDSGDEGDEASAVRLYEVYRNDLLAHPGRTPLRQGFREWIDAMVWKKAYVEDVMRRLPERLEV